MPWKTCTMDCVFCQLGRTTDRTVIREEYVPTTRVTRELDRWADEDGEADFITLSGSGEPTLHSRFGEVLEHMGRVSSVPSLLLTNGSLLHLPEVRRSAALADVVKVSLCAWDAYSFDTVNRPHRDLCLEALVEGEAALAREMEGELWLEVFLVRGLNDGEAGVRRIAELAARIGPDRVQLNTAVRPPAESSVRPVRQERLAELATLFDPPAETVGDRSGPPGGSTGRTDGAILALLRRRPATLGDIAGAFGMNPGEVSKRLGHLASKGLVRAVQTEGGRFFEPSRREPEPAPDSESEGGG